jgi:hypothetical protein
MGLLSSMMGPCLRLDHGMLWSPRSHTDSESPSCDDGQDMVARYGSKIWQRISQHTSYPETNRYARCTSTSTHADHDKY